MLTMAMTRLKRFCLRLIAQATGTGTGTCTGTGTGAVDGPRTPVGSMLADGRELRQRAPPETVTAKADKDKDKAVGLLTRTRNTGCRFLTVAVGCTTVRW